MVWERFTGKGRGEAGRRWVGSPRPPTPLGGLRSYTHQMADRLIEWMNQSPEIVMPSVERDRKKEYDSRLACGPIGCISLNFRTNQLCGPSTSTKSKQPACPPASLHTG